MPGTLDLVVAALFAITWPLIEYFYTWPRHVRAVDAGDPSARTRMYQRAVFEQWSLSALVLVVMLRAGRDPRVLGLTMPHGWGLWVGLALPVAYAVLIWAQAGPLLRSPASIARVRVSISPLRALIPHTRGEHAWFRPLAVTAGLCEEWLFRGYLVWVLQAWIGVWAAAGVSMVIFGLGHLYQGRAYAPRAFVAGAVMGLLALATGSLLPGMLLHAVVDLMGGWFGYRVMSAPMPPAEAAA